MTPQPEIKICSECGEPVGADLPQPVLYSDVRALICDECLLQPKSGADTWTLQAAYTQRDDHIRRLRIEGGHKAEIRLWERGLSRIQAEIVARAAPPAAPPIDPETDKVGLW